MRTEEGRFTSVGVRDVDEVKLIEFATPPKELPCPSRLGRTALARIGASFVNQLQRDVKFDRTRLVASVCVAAKVKKNVLKRFMLGLPTEGLIRRWKKGGAMPTQRPGSRGGRVQGSGKFADKDLKAVLQPFTASSSRWSKKQDEPMHTLRGSLKSVYDTVEELRAIYSYRHVARRLMVSRAKRLGISVGKRRTYVCSTCACWDKVVKVRVQAALEEITDTLATHVQGYWDSWETYCVAKGWASGASRLLNAEYFKQMVGYIKDHPRSHREHRAGLDEEALQMIESVTIYQLTGEKSICDAVADFSVHFRLRDYLAEKLRGYCEEPQ